MRNTVRFCGKVYADAHKNGWINSLAVYILICKKHTGKSFYFKPKQKTLMLQKLSKLTGIGYTSLHLHIRILKEKGMIEFLPSGEMKLIGNKQRNLKVRSNHILYVRENIDTISDIKILLNSIPFLSNLRQQKREIEKKEHLKYIKEHYFSNEITKGERKYFRTQDKKYGGVFESDDVLRCAVQTIGKLVERKSNSTVCKYKKNLKKLKVIKYYNECHAVYTNVTFADYTFIRSNDMLGIKGGFFYKGNIYIHKPTEFEIFSNSLFIKTNTCS